MPLASKRGRADQAHRTPESPAEALAAGDENRHPTAHPTRAYRVTATRAADPPQELDMGIGRLRGAAAVVQCARPSDAKIPEPSHEGLRMDVGRLQGALQPPKTLDR